MRRAHGRVRGWGFGLALLVVLVGIGMPATAATATASTSAPDFALPFPCGEAWHGTTRAGHSHALAVDFNSYEGEEWEHRHPVLASADGVVLSSGYETDYEGYGYTGFGNYVLLAHGDGWTTFYAHLDFVQAGIGPGVEVDRGTMLGGVGNTGRGSRQHLHYEQALDGRVQRASFHGQTLPWGVDVESANCPEPPDECSVLMAFPDVSVGSYYDRAVQWMADESISYGIGPDHLFFPTWSTTRGQVATLIWRAAGRPAAPFESPFADVDPWAFYGRAVSWMADAGLTTGTGPGEFEPERPVTRAEVITLLWRWAGSPVGHPRAGFDDVEPDRYFEPAVRWATALAVTTGVGDTGRFMPSVVVTRSEVAAFLYRQAGSPLVTPVTACSTTE